MATVVDAPVSVTGTDATLVPPVPSATVTLPIASVGTGSLSRMVYRWIVFAPRPAPDAPVMLTVNVSSGSWIASLPMLMAFGKLASAPDGPGDVHSLKVSTPLRTE